MSSQIAFQVILNVLVVYCGFKAYSAFVEAYAYTKKFKELWRKK
jgi:hypothetical protein